MPEVFIQGGEGKLQAKYSPSEQEKPNIAIVLHPNPKHGGTMDSKVNYAAFKVMKDAGFSTLRINFRGVGKSDGAFTEGEGELNDASVSLDWLQKKNEDFRSCWIVGFSFGAWIGFQTLMRRPEVDGLILIAPPVNLYDFNFLSIPSGFLIYEKCQPPFSKILILEYFVLEKKVSNLHQG